MADRAAARDFAALERIAAHLQRKVAGAKYLAEKLGPEEEASCAALDNVVDVSLIVALEASEIALADYAVRAPYRTRTMARLHVAVKALEMTRESIHHPLRDSASTRIELATDMLRQAQVDL